MVKQVSYTALERQFRALLRDNLEKCEAPSDVEERFSRVGGAFLREVLGEATAIGPEDLTLAPEAAPPYRVSPEVQGAPGFGQAMDASDLPHILERFADKARAEYLRLKKAHPQSEQKIRNPQRRT